MQHHQPEGVKAELGDFIVIYAETRDTICERGWFLWL